MKKKMKINLILLFLILLTACTPNYYLKPEITGQLYDNRTKKPITNTLGYIGFSLNEDTTIKTSNEGKFKITPEVQKYYIFRPNWKKLSASAPYIYIYFEGYQSKTYDYSDTDLKDIKENSAEKILEKVDVGKIFLDSK